MVEGRPLDDGKLVALAKDGDVAAYERLVALYQAVAFRTALVVTRSAAEAEDAAQEAFVKAYYALDRFRVGEPFRPWLLRIVVNEARNSRRAVGRREGLALRASQFRPSGEAAPSPEAAALAAAERERLLAAVESLKESDREIIGLRYFLELTEQETATALGIPPGTVKSRLSRAVDRLRAQMEIEPEGEAS